VLALLAISILLLAVPASQAVGAVMVVLCGDRDTQPVVNTGTLNH